MAVNLLDSAKGYLTDHLVNQISRMLGEDQQHTQKAFDGALPVVLNGIVQKVAKPGGISAVMDLVSEVSIPNRANDEVIVPVGGVLTELEGALSADTQPGSLLSMGADINHSLFGSNSESIAGALASYSGIKQSSASSILNLTGPILLTVIRLKMADHGNGLSGLTSLLNSQTANLQSALPSGLRTFPAQLPSEGKN